MKKLIAVSLIALGTLTTVTAAANAAALYDHGLPSWAQTAMQGDN